MTTNRLYTITECALFALACVMIVLLVGCAPDSSYKQQPRIHASYDQWQAFIQDNRE